MASVLKIEDLIGTTYSRLTIFEEGVRHIEPNGKSQRVMVCKCSCGNITKVQLKELRRGSTKSCGCLNSEQALDITKNNKFGHWTILKEVESYRDNNGNKSRRVEAQCVCGKKKKIILNSIVQGNSTSCGCMINYSTGERVNSNSPIKPLNLKKANNKKIGNWEIIEEISAKRRDDRTIKRFVKAKCKCGYIKETTLDKMSESKQCATCAFEEIRSRMSEEERVVRKKLQCVFGGMKSRCYNKNNKSYLSYGGRGILISEEWKNNFEEFYKWSVNNGYREKVEIDRIDGSKGYFPDNCRYISKDENLLHVLGLTEEDVLFIRSKDFNFDSMVSSYSCSPSTIRNILEYKTFKSIYP